ncbi:methionine aminopeptidase, type I [Bacteriovorax sp. BSW11_IV]|uniref:type I methionyl aminopeptidase n=1 Tax=Bacteriovorax sp. BSW11_IV TaxID=1353529 RepID=UPI00038A360D|nr:type I methionyl aminopeptidase [Bacteriovorax sp. BSW11_IV]EQC48636.1 methionine aminopeptidase, type I [Bacteriovorax sp. BSW11_IV]
MISLKTEEDLVLYRETGRIAGEILTRLIPEVKAGVSTYHIAKLAEKWIREDYDAIPSSIGQYDFQFALNSSVNNVVCHGVPSESEILKDGDIVNLDVTVKKHGFIADTSRMYIVGEASEDAKKLCEATREALFKGIEQVKPGNTLGDIGFYVHKHATRNGYSVVKEYCGHGIGRSMHEEPQVLHYGKKGKGLKLQKGMVFTIEPMLNEGSGGIKHLEDDWTVVTQDGKLSAQWEHTIAVTDNGFEILTLRDEERG